MKNRNIFSFKQLQNDYSQRVNQVLTAYIDNLPGQTLPLVDAMRYSLLLGGKRIRPFLVYATGTMLGVPLAELDAPAAAIECIHAYSLLHDDLPAMDNDDLRRGQPTCHIKFGEAQAILAGDALQSLAFSILASPSGFVKNADDRLSMLYELANASGSSGMCFGQSLDLLAEGQHISLDELEQIHQYKTGALIRSAVRMAALTAGPSANHLLPKLDCYANAIGLAFQVQDDILDIIGDTNILGKRQGADQQNLKSTYPALLGLDVAKCKAEQLINDANAILAQLESANYDTRQLQLLTEFIIQRDN